MCTETNFVDLCQGQFVCKSNPIKHIFFYNITTWLILKLPSEYISPSVTAVLHHSLSQWYVCITGQTLAEIFKNHL